MIFNFEDIQKAIALEEEVGNVDVIAGSENCITIYDCIADKETTFTSEQAICEEWLASRIFISPKAKHKFGLKESEISRLLLLNLPKTYFITLNSVFIIYKQSDWRYVSSRLCGNKYSELCFDKELFWSDQVGLMCNGANSVFVNMRNIERETKKIWADSNWIWGKEILFGMWSTLFHEFRHLMLDTNIFLPEDEYPDALAEESAVEQFGNLTAENMKY